MSPKLLAAEMLDLEQAALAEADLVCRQAIGDDQNTWTAEDWDWRAARIDRVHAVFHMPASAS
jgi:hypothetical protein